MAKKQTTTPDETHLIFERHYKRSHLDVCVERNIDKRRRHHCGLVRRLSRLVEKEGWDNVDAAYETLLGINQRIVVILPPEYR